jgi:hypothetical protein
MWVFYLNWSSLSATTNCFFCDRLIKLSNGEGGVCGSDLLMAQVLDLIIAAESPQQLQPPGIVMWIAICGNTKNDLVCSLGKVLSDRR